jgi:CubicO group peptidase (beta-lactamase class C family)
MATPLGRSHRVVLVPVGLLACIVIGPRVAAAAPRADPARIKAIIDAERQRLHIAGVAYAVVVDDQVVALDAVGLRDVDRKLSATPDTRFPIGSCTKAFTAMLAAIGQDEGKLSLDDSPHRYLPYFRMRDPEADTLVSLRDMLSGA